MALHPHLAQKHLDEAKERLRAVYAAQREWGLESRRVYERFYNSLALFSGGTIALSITYLGYLKTLDSQPLGTYFLVGSWISLFVCLLTSVFWSFVNAHYFHYAIERECSSAAKEQREAEADGIYSFNVVNITRQELETFETKLRQVAMDWERKADQNKTKEDWYLRGWLLLGRIARVSFVLGIALLLSFAIKNT